MPPDTIAAAIATLLFGLLLVPTALRLRSREQVVFHLLLYVVLSLATSLSILLAQFEGVTPLPPPVYLIISQGALLFLVLSFGALTLDFVKTSQRRLLNYWVMALVIFLAWGIIAFDPLGWGQRISNLLVQAGLAEARWAAVIMQGLGWLFSISASFIALTLDFRRRHPTQYLNKLRYWVVSMALLTAGGIVFFTSPQIFNWAGLALLTAAGVLVGYIALSHHTPDLRLLIGRAVRYAGVMMILFTAYFLSMAALIFFMGNQTAPLNAILLAGVLALVLANLTMPLRKLSYDLLSWLIFGKQQKDARQVIRHYSRSISAALDMNRLGEILINLMVETLGISRGIVLTGQATSLNELSLRPLASVGFEDSQLTTGFFSGNSPFIQYFRNEGKILSQYDINVLPQFRQMAAEEKTWLAGLDMELFVAIIREREFIGLLAFGQQGQGTAYYEEDRDLMINLADQAALAMDSARLFEQLAIVNQEVGALNNRLAGLDQGKADFLSIASHELRTPLTHIHGYSRMLLDLTEDEMSDPAYVRTIIEGIAKGSERMKGVIDVMFDVTEVDVGEMSLFTGEVVLEEVIDMATRPFLSALDERRIAFGKKGIKDLPLIEADGTRLVQAFENLISNAIKYTPDGGVVTIEGRSYLDEKRGLAVEIAVIDTGIGIAPEHHQTIFEKFFRVDDTDHHSTGKTKFKGGGPGLGLTLVRGIAEAHGGRVWVESLGCDEVNLPGSKFFFVIPVAQPQKEKKSGQRQSQIDTRHWRSKDLPEKTAET